MDYVFPLRLVYLAVEVVFSTLILSFIVAMVLSWLPISPSNQFSRIVNTIIRPIREPFDRRIPPIGAFSISFLVAIWAVYFVENLILYALPYPWQ